MRTPKARFIKGTKTIKDEQRFIRRVEDMLDMRGDVAHRETSTSFDLCPTSLADLANRIQIVAWTDLGKPQFVGQGTFCKVFIGTLGPKKVAAKVLKAEYQDNQMAVDDLDAEMRIMGNLNHPHVLEALGRGKMDHCSFVLLEALAKTLAETLPGPEETTPIWTRRHSIKSWPLSRAVDCARQVGDALRYLHFDAFKGFAVLHRDLKPQNMGFGFDGKLKLFDFGLAKCIHKDGTEETTPCKMTGQTGSIRYMSPEVALGEPYSRPADVFSWSIILWQMAAHKIPFHGMSAASHRAKVAQEGHRPEILEHWPAALSTLLCECFDANASRRPSFKQVVPCLESLLEQLERDERKQPARRNSSMDSLIQRFSRRCG
mmetsp:Transcript_13614/g.22608  ORF Transcript_13614/g.22608 Transcript_13614/m.22608 type:complete len:374 (+) Transcript_13614:95-1216(+)